jgi:hypothetical protein
MSGKVPVGKTISDGYGFAFRSFFSILGIVWFPYLLVLVIGAALVWLLAPHLLHMLALHDLDLPALMEFLRVVILIAVVGFIVDAMVTVGIQRKALGMHPGPVWFFFSLGLPVWRMAGTFFLAAIVIFLIALVTGGVCVAIWYAASGLGSALWVIRVVDACAAGAFIIYVLVRLMFFLPAVVVEEETIGLERAWILGGHNFWRVLLVGLAVILPVAIVFHILALAIFGHLGGWQFGAQAGTLEIARAVLRSGAVSPFGILFQLLERIVLIGVMNGAVASAYLSVGAKKFDAPASLAASPAV